MTARKEAVKRDKKPRQIMRRKNVIKRDRKVNLEMEFFNKLTRVGP